MSPANTVPPRIGTVQDGTPLAPPSTTGLLHDIFVRLVKGKVVDDHFHRPDASTRAPHPLCRIMDNGTPGSCSWHHRPCIHDGPPHRRVALRGGNFAHPESDPARLHVRAVVANVALTLQVTAGDRKRVGLQVGQQDYSLSGLLLRPRATSRWLRGMRFRRTRRDRSVWFRLSGWHCTRSTRAQPVGYVVC